MRTITSKWRWAALIVLAFCLPKITNSQSLSKESQRLTQMANQEQKVQSFIQEHLNDAVPESVTDYIQDLLAEEKTHDHAELTSAQKQQLGEQVIRRHWRDIYFSQNPQTRSLYEPDAIGNCVNGGFEMGNFLGYGAASGKRASTIPDCGTDQVTFCSEPPQTAETCGGNSATNVAIVTVGADPFVASLPRVRTGNNAARINQSTALFGMNQITKRLVLTQPTEDISFWYSLVMQNPAGHVNNQPFFTGRVLDASGNVLDECCQFADAANPFFNSINPGGSVIVYSPYFCKELEASGNIGDTVTLEISVADCGAGGHWGYGYVDDICDSCTIDSCNYQGGIDLLPTDTCSDLPIQVCGTFDPAILNCDTSRVDTVFLDILQNGVVVTTLPIPLTSYDLLNGTFCFTVDSTNFPSGASGGFDFEVTIVYGLQTATGPASVTQTDLHTNPGMDNDYIFDADCCPKFNILDCCTYWDSTSFDPTGGRIDPDILEIMTEYRGEFSISGAENFDSICDPCANPTDSFPVFIVDANGNLIDDTFYQIAWSHHSGWTAAYDYIFPQQQTIVTVFNPNDSCLFTDTFFFDCCEKGRGFDSICCDSVDFDIEINELCFGCDPCDDPTKPFIINVESNGQALGSPYTFLWSNGSTGSTIQGFVDTEYWVQVTDTATGCIASDTFFYECCDCDVQSDFIVTVNECRADFRASPILDSCLHIDKWTWDFGDGTVGSGPNPSHTYPQNGVYTACLIVEASNSNGERCSDTICQVITIANCCRCEVSANFNVSVVDVCTRRFIRQVQTKCANIAGYQWDFGDGGTSTATNPTHAYSNGGTYTVCLIVTALKSNSDGTVTLCYDTICKPVVVNPNCLSMSAQGGEQLEVFPNPFSGEVTLMFVMENEDEVSVSLADAQGRIIKTMEPQVMPAGKRTIEIDGKSWRLSPGIYILKLRVGEAEFTRTLFYQKE